ncbi:MAG: AAA family ATPase, partial [Xanthomonadaceae bacterium]|nr:AAA family ATPase [Xanthomonadaceae bacterium]
MPRDIDHGIWKVRNGGCGWYQRDPFAELYALRLLRLAPLGRDFAKAAAGEPHFCEILGFDPDGPTPTVRDFNARIDERLVALLDQLDRLGSALHRNISALADALGLDHAEAEVLRFALLLHANPVIEMTVDTVRSPLASDPYFCTAHACGLPVDVVKAALSPRGTLHSSGLVQVDRNARADMNLKARLDVMMRFGLVLSSDAFSPEDLLGQCAGVAPASTLSTDDYQHLGDHAELVERLLAVALERRERGINVLLWGPPGTGKTEFARLLADRLSCTVREVVSDDAEGDAVAPSQRGAVLAIAQRLLEDRADTVLVFDEMEDLLGGRSRYQLRGAAQGKAWLNRLLETNPVPTVWISNDADQFDPAILRRFSYVVKFGVPPIDARRRVIARHLDGLAVADELLEQLASAESLPPACIGQAAR